MTRTQLGKACMALGVLASLAMPAKAQNWDMATPYPASNFHERNITQFAKDVSSATDGELKITVHPANSLIAHPQIRNSVRNGVIPLGEFLLGRLSNEDPIFELDMLPFLVDGYADAKTLWEASRPAIEKAFAKQGLKVLFAVPWPNNGIYTDKDLKSVDDLRDLKFRTYNTTTDRFAQLVGAVPTQVEVPDIAQAFATGRVGGMITSAATGVNISAWDFVDRYYRVKSFLGKNIVVVNARMFEALPETTRKAVLDAAAEAEKRGWALSRKNNEDGAAMLAKHGMDVQTPSRSLEDGLHEVGETMLNEWKERAGPAGEAIVEKLEAGD